MADHRVTLQVQLAHGQRPTPTRLLRAIADPDFELDSSVAPVLGRQSRVRTGAGRPADCWLIEGRASGPAVARLRVSPTVLVVATVPENRPEAHDVEAGGGRPGLD